MFKKVGCTAFALCCVLWANAFTIKIDNPDMANAKIRIAYAFEGKHFLQDSVQLDPRGHAEYTAKPGMRRGIYILLLPNQQFVEFIRSNDPVYAIRFKGQDLIGTMEILEGKENKVFHQYQVEMGKLSKLENKDERQKQMDEYNAKILKTYPKSLLASIIQCIEPIHYDPGLPADTPKRDSLTQIAVYNYYKEHYFDKVNFAESGLIRTSFYKQKFDLFFDKILPPLPVDTLEKYISICVNRSRVDSFQFHYVTEYFFQKYQKSDLMGHDAIVVYLADKVMLNDAWWADAEYKKKIEKRVNELRKNLIGEIAPELVLPSLEDQNKFISLHSLPQKYVILYFYEPTCGFCAKETPKLVELYNKIKDQGVEVYAVNTDYNRKIWQEYVKAKGMNWINVWDGVEMKVDGKDRVFSIGYDLRELYDVNSTPRIYLLNAKHQIIGKRIDTDGLRSIFKQLGYKVD